MEAFDLQDLVLRLKAKGLPIAEEAAELLYAEVMKWLLDGVALQDNALVKALAPVLVASIDPLVKKQLNKIDGVEG